MNKYNIIFTLNTTEKIIIHLEESLENVDCCYRTDITLLQENQYYLLSIDPIHYSITRFHNFLNKALYNELYLHKSLTNDIGYLCNEYYQNTTGFVTEELIGGSTWVGYKYHLWEAASKDVRLVTWLYNKPDGSIIIEITPCYPYLYCEPTEEPNYISYNEWIKTYKPYLIREIPHAIAQEWLKQAEYIIQTIESNAKKWKNIQ
ncbi:MAG TPA: hypothetical protein VLB80_03095 [Candidatus Babeliales bacterium]|nr:hypothetical protein [Candidatus Babeliales bacterium]